MVVEESPVPWTRRWQVWVAVLAIVAAATVGGLAWVSRSQPVPASPELHVGGLAKRPDGEFLRFLPTRADFPRSLQGFVTLTAADLREHPEPSLQTDPPECDPTAPLRSPAIIAETRTGSVTTASYTFGVTRVLPDQDLVASLRTWLSGCATATLPPVGSGQEARQRMLTMTRLPDPEIGADRAISYSITVTDAAADGADDALYPPQTHVMTLAEVRGVALYCLARDASLAFGAQDRAELFSKLVQRIRMY